MADVIWNPDDKHADLTLSNGNLTMTAAASSYKSARATESKNSGKWYWEITVDKQTSSYYVCIGGGVATAILNTILGGNTIGDSVAYLYNGLIRRGNMSASYGDPFTTGDIIGVALDMDNGKIWFSKNGVWQNSGDPAAGTGEAYSSIVGPYYPMACIYYTADAVTSNFGASLYSYDIPIGFRSIGYTGYFEGYVYELNNPVSRSLFIHRRDSGILMSSTTSSGNGYYYATTTYSGSHYIVCLDDVSGESYNDLIIGNVYPTTVSG